MPAKGTRTPSGLLIRGNSASSGGGPVTPTDPSQLTSLVGWWDASDAASIISAGGKVSQWSNKKAGGAHAVQATGANQPITGARTMNGLNVLDFTGNPMRLSTVSSQWVNATDGSWTVLVAMGRDTGSQGYTVTSDDGGAARVAQFAVAEATRGITTVFDSPITAAFVDTKTGIPAAGTATFLSATRTPTAVEVWVAGASDGSSPTTGGVPKIATVLEFGYNQGTSLDGVLAEIIVCNAALSTVDRQAMEAYLAAKWNGPITAAGFDPASIAGLAAWYDASDAASIVSAAGRVSQWRDKSGANRHLNQATSGNQPLTGSATINSKNALNFTSARSDVLINTTLAGPATNTGTWFMAVRGGTPVANERWMSFNNGTGPDWNQAQSLAAFTRNGGQGNVVIYYLGGATYGDASPIMVPGTPIVLTGQRSTVGGGTLQMWGAGVTRADAVGGSANFGFTQLAVGGSGVPAEAGNNDIAEVLWYSTALNGTDRLAVESYLKTKWGAT